MARTSTTSGNWSSNGTWVEGSPPANTDAVTIAAGHTVTLDNTSCVALSVALNNGTVGAGGTLQPTNVANSKLTVEQGITAAGTSSGSGAYSSNMAFDMSASSYTCELLINNVNGSYDSVISGNFTFKGAVRKRHTVLTAGISAGATTATVSDATGWKQGDTIVFATTSAYNATPRVDLVTLNGSYVDGSTTLTWTGGTTYAHANDCPVGNLNSNLIIGGNTSGNTAFVIASGANAMNANGYVTDILFKQLGSASGTYSGNSFALSTTSNAEIVSVSNNAFYQNRQHHFGLLSLQSPFTRDSNIFYSDVQVAGRGIINASDANNLYYGIGKDTNLVAFRGSGGYGPRYADQHLEDSKLSGLSWSTLPNRAAFVAAGNQKLIRTKIWSCLVGVETIGLVEDCVFGDQCFTGANNDNLFGAMNAQVTVQDSKIQTGGANIITRLAAEYPSATIFFKNKNDLPDNQEIYGGHSNTQPIIKKNTAVGEHSTSSFEFQFNSTTLDVTYEFDVPVKSATAVRIIVFIKKDTNYYAGTYDQPTAVLSGLGITPVTATATSASNNAWERLILDLAAGSAPSSDGNLKITLRGKSNTAGAKCWFSGVPNAPFITRCRHFGYIFDEAAAPRTRNNTVTLAATDPALPTSAELTSAESAAYGITGISVTGGTSTSPVTLSGSKTFQQLYDYTQAWCANSLTNVGYAVPVEGSGANGSPSLLAKANVTVNATYTLNGSGSLNLGSYTLTTEFAGGSAYTYTGGTWGQATTVPTFSGGTLNIGAAGTYTYTQAAAMILSMTPTAPGTYALGGSTFTGQVDLRNTSGTHAITVELPSGTSYTTANNTGAAITVSTPAIYQSVVISGAVAGSRIQVYDTTSNTELYNGTPTFPHTWTDSSPAAANRAIRLRVSYCVGTSAKKFIEANIGTCGTSESTKTVSYLVNQVNDTTYNANAIDGPTVYATSGITFTDAIPDRVNCNIAGGSVTLPTIYACFVYWNFTATGIANDFTYVDAPDAANYILSGMKIRNTSTVDLMVTGGYVRDASTGLSKDCIDTAGSAGNIFLAPDHVVPFATGSGVTAQDKVDIASTVLAAAAAAPISANMEQTNGTDLKGDGTAGNKFRSVLVA